MPPTYPTLLLSREQWQARERAHQQRADDFTRGYRERAGTTLSHPVDDFLFTYYPLRPGLLRRWHPGAGVMLEGAAASERAHWKWYQCDPGEPVEPDKPSSQGNLGSRGSRGSQNDSGDLGVALGNLSVDAAGFVERNERSIRFIVSLLSVTASRPANLGCFGLHEWAMVYRAGDAGAGIPSDTPTNPPVDSRGGGRRHDVPLRLGQAATDSVVESHNISCTHFDAYRFFTPDALPLNRAPLTRESQPRLEQPGCLHAGMDVYKWATKLGPLIPGELLLDCFELARDIRQLDMSASPYDLGDWGYTPIAIETAEGKAEYSRQQAVFAERGNRLRARVVDAMAGLLPE